MTRTSSIEAYHDLVDLDILGKKQAEVLRIMIEVNKTYGAVTRAELFKYGEIKGFKGYKMPEVSARLSELRDMGSIEERAKRQCTITNRNVLTWHITGDKPQKVTKITKKARKELIRDYMTVMLNQAPTHKAKEDLKVLWRMIKEL